MSQVEIIGLFSGIFMVTLLWAMIGSMVVIVLDLEDKKNTFKQRAFILILCGPLIVLCLIIREIACMLMKIIERIYKALGDKKDA